MDSPRLCPLFLLYLCTDRRARVLARLGQPRVAGPRTKTLHSQLQQSAGAQGPSKGSASPTSLNSRDGARTQRQVHLATSCSRRTDENGGGSLAWVSVCLGFLCVVEEIGLQSEFPHSPKLCKNLMKIFFLPHQSLFYACVLQWAAKPHYCSVTICSLLIYYFLLLLISCTETILVSAMTLHVPGV